MTVVLAYQGAPSQRKEAQAKLCRVLPGVILTYKTGTVVEAQLNDDEVMRATSDANWRVIQPVYADIRKPTPNYQRLRAKLPDPK